MSGRVQTVLGDVAPAALGRTLTHEHLSMQFGHFYRPPPPALAARFPAAHAAPTLQTAGLLRQYPYSSRYNLTLNDADTQRAVISDVHTFKAAGGGTIVENSTEGLDRDLSFLVRVARETGVHVVAGTGFYIADVQSEAARRRPGEELYAHMLAELTAGCRADPAVRAGFIGEVASVWPIKEFERRAIVAAGECSEQTGAGVSFHPHRAPAAPAAVLRLYLEAGGRADRAVMSHLDRTLLDEDKLLEFAELGSYCQLDLFGVEVSYYQLAQETDMPSDAVRLRMLDALVADGRRERVLMSHDIHTKHRLTEFGGHGYAHILSSVVPRMRARGIHQALVDLITVENPQRWLTIHGKH